MRKKNLKKVFLLTVLLGLLLFGLTGCGSEKTEMKVKSVDDLEGSRIGVQLGTTGDIYASDYEEDEAGTKIERYNKGNDAIQSLLQGKVDCVIIDEQPANAFVEKNKTLRILPEEFANEDYAICVSKENVKLKSKINEALSELRDDGTLDKIIKNYIGDDTRGKYPYELKEGLTYENGTLTMATNAAFKPYEYYENNEIVGIDVDMVRAIADKLNMKLEIEDMEFDSIITAVQSGKADIGAAGMTVTEDRLKNIDFTDSYTTAKQVIVVWSGEKEGFRLEKLKSDFYDNFVKDGRYKYYLQGLARTCQIAFFAVILGIILGFGIALVRTVHDQNGGLRILNAVCKCYLTIIRGTPTMVQLLIIYYVIFASTNVSKVLVAVIAFGVNSGAYVAEIVRGGIMSIDRGQFEAGRSLGLNYSKTMRFIIFPQTVRNVLPALANEFIVLLKETAISGYIGLVDLTKGGDIVRSQTYNAFMPLFAVAIVYLLIVMVLTNLVGRLERRLRANER